MMFKVITVFVLWSIVVSKAAEPLPLSKDYWKSDAFRKAFNGSYRINARIEPFVDTKERVLLVAVQELMAKGERKSALSKLLSSSLSKSSAAVMFNIGNIAFESGDLKLAKAQYLAAIKKFPTFLRAHQNLAFVYAREEDYDKAFPHLLGVVKLGSQDGSVMGLLGYCYQQKENFTSALQAFKNAQLTEPGNVDWRIGEAYCYDSLGEKSKALNLYEVIVKENPDEDRYVLLLIYLYQKTGKIEEAIVNLELLRRQGKLDASNQMLLGGLHLREGSRVIGREVIRAVLKSDQLSDANVAMNSVDYALSENQLDLAREFHGMINLKLVKNSDRYERQKAQMLIMEGKEIEKALAILNELIAKEPLDADSLYLLAEYESKHALMEEALIHYEQAHAGKGRMKDFALLKKGKLLVRLKRYDEALKDLIAYQEYEKGFQLEQLKTYIEAVKNLQQVSSSD